MNKRGLKTRTPISNSVNTELLIKLKKLSSDTLPVLDPPPL